MSGLFLFFLRNINKTIFIIMTCFVFQYNYAALGIDQKKTNQENAQRDNFDQAQSWYKRLRDTYVDIDFLSAEVQAHYKKIDVTSSPQNTANSLFIASVSNLGKPVPKNFDGTYRCEDISFKINIPENFDAMEEMNKNLSFSSSDDTDIQCSVVNDKKEPCFPRFTSVHDLLNDKFICGAFLLHKVNHQAIVSHANGKIYVIDIEIKNRRHYPIKVAGIAIIYNKTTEKTDVFFDFIDMNGKSIEYIKPVFSCKHAKQVGDNKKIIYVCEHQLFESDAKDIIGFFDSPVNYAAWVSDPTNFYDFKKQRIVNHLPGLYKNIYNNSGTPCEPRVWVFGNDEDHNSFYELQESIKSSDMNDYVYSFDDGTLRATLQLTNKVRECCTFKNEIALSCLLFLMKPSLKIHNDITFVGGYRSWPQGIYKKIRNGDAIIWQRIECHQSTEIEQVIRQDQIDLNLNSGIIVDSWFKKAMTVEENNDWCIAAQKLLHHFEAKIDCCNKALLDTLTISDRLIKLQISHLNIDDKTIEMPAVFKAISSLKQLTKLDFSYNSPVVDFNEDYRQLADRSSSLFLDVSTCVSQLTKLQKLYLQGLWLQPQALLGEGVHKYGVSKEVAILTGIINHKNSEGVHAIIHAVSTLPELQDLSIDSIPCHGSSFADRWKSNGYYVWLGISSLTYFDRVKQEANLKKLAGDSAQSLAKNSSLRKIHIYSPQCKDVDYFSADFRDKLMESTRPKNARRLIITPSTLE